MNQERLYKWDNVKTLLIILVVIGHFLGALTKTSDLVCAIYLYIHVFHMPLFVFVSGLFSVSALNDRKKLINRCIGFLGLCFLQKYAMVLIELCFGTYEKFTLSKTWGASWYLFVMAVYLVATYILRNVDRRLLFVFAIITAVFAGYDTGISGKWMLSRIFVFYPFFLLGTMWNRKWYRVRSLFGNLLLKLAALGVLVLAWKILWENLAYFNGLKKLFLGFYDYSRFLDPVNPGALYRLVYYLAAFLMCFAVIIICPEWKIPFVSGIGARSMQVYIYHYPIRDILELVGWHVWLQAYWPENWELMIIPICILLTFVLALPFLEWPIKWYWKAIGRGEKQE